MKKHILFPLLLLGVLLSSFQSDAPAEQKQTIFQYFQENEIREMTLELNYKEYRKNHKTENYIPAKLIVVLPDSSLKTWDIDVRPRGNTRRKLCDAPPMKLRFSDEQLEETGLKKRNTLKMVNLCRQLGKYDQMLLKEYLAYRFYNKITDHSLRVHWVKMKYVNTDKNEVRDESYAFFIEHPNDLADRMGLDPIDDRRAKSLRINNDESEVFTFFQYMIGNTDWFYFNTHNVELFRDAQNRQIIPVPYDFDYSGLVNAPYAVADERLKIRHVTERYYQGNCRDLEETQRTVNHFLEKKEAIFQVMDEVPGMKKGIDKSMRKYITSFYNILEKEKCWKREIAKSCDRWPVP